MNILLACECSGIVRDAFRERGHNAVSCELKPCERGSRYHIQDHALNVICDGWDMLIAFPPCTHLAVSGARWFDAKYLLQCEAITFFLSLANAPIKKKCIENPVGIMSTFWRQPDQIIQPYFFGDEVQKTTCLWLEGLPKLTHYKQTDLFNEKSHVYKGDTITWGSGVKMQKWFNDTKKADKALTSELRSRTFPGIANAMAMQWG